MPALRPHRLPSSVVLALLLQIVGASSLQAQPVITTLGCDGDPHAGQPLLQCTPEADTTDPFILAKAQDLGHDPQAIIAFVTREIGYEVYRGSLRGARGTLWTAAGNALDRASLAVALLRASGVEARYVQGALGEPDASALIGTMFPAVRRVVGCPPANALRADPEHDPTLLAEAADHYWIEVGPQRTPVDLAFADGVVRGTRSGDFTEVPPALRHTVGLTMEVETHNVMGGFARQEPLHLELLSAELSGRPLTAGQLVSTTGAGGLLGATIVHTYSPYLRVGEGTSGERMLLRGADYQELVGTVFGSLGNQTVTRVALRVAVRGIDGSREEHERVLLDRLGVAAREGVLTASGPPSGSPQAALSDLDLVTLYALPGKQQLLSIADARPRLGEIATELEAVRPIVDALPPSGPATAAEREAVAAVTRLSREAAILTATTTTAAYAGAADEAIERMERGYMSRAYARSPRLLIAATSLLADGEVRFALDLRRTELRVVPAPGQVQNLSFFFRMAQGALESSLEDVIVRQIAPGDVRSASAILGSLPADASLVFIDAHRLTDLDRLGLSAEASTRIRLAVAAGRVVLVPDRMIPIGGGSTVAWWEIDSRTGQSIAVSEDGGHQVMVQYAMLLRGPIQQFAALVAGFGLGFSAGTFDFLGQFLDAMGNGVPFDEALRTAKGEMVGNLVEAILDLLGIKIPIPGISETVVGQVYECLATIEVSEDGTSFFDLSPENVAECAVDFLVEIGLDEHAKAILEASEQVTTAGEIGAAFGYAAAIAWVQANFQIDPIVFPFLSEPSLPQTSPPLGAGISAVIVRDPLFMELHGGLEVPSVYRIGIRNGGTEPRTATIRVPAQPSDFVVTPSVETIRVPPGATVEVGLCGAPTALPTEGARDLGIVLTGDGLPPGGLTVPGSIDIPALHDVTVVAVPSTVAVAPGASVPFSIVVTARGNVDETVALAVDLPPWAQLVGATLPVVELAPGASRTIDGLMIAIAPNAPLGDGTLTVRAELCAGASPGTCIVPEARRVGTTLLRVRSAAVAALDEASRCAVSAGQDRFAELVAQLRNALEQLEAMPSDAVRCERARVVLDAVVSALRIDALPASCVQDLAGVTADVPSCELAALDGLLERSRNAVTLDASPRSVALEPGTTQGVTLTLTSKSTADVTLALTATGAPSGVAVDGAGAVTVPAGAVVQRQLRLTASAQTPTPTTFALVVEAVPTGAPAAAQTAAVHVGIHQALADVVTLVATPGVVDPGVSPRVSAEILNTSNARRPVVLRLELPDDPTVPPTDVAVELRPSIEPVVVDLGLLSTTGLTPGLHRLRAQLFTPTGAPVPGASGEELLFVGSLVRADIVTSPTIVPPGDSQVAATLSVESAIAGVEGPGSVAPTDPTIDRINWAAASRGATIMSPGSHSNVAATILIDERPSGTETWVGSDWRLGQSIVVDLGAAREIDLVQLHLWDGDDRFYRYRVETSADDVEYAPAVDATSGEHRGLQRHAITSRMARYVRITGTFGTASDGLHLIDELLVVGSYIATPVPQQTLTLNGIDDSGSTSTSGQRLRLNAGTYEVKHVGGAISPYSSDSANNGRAWNVVLDVEVPALNKTYRFGNVHPAQLTSYPTAAEAEVASVGMAFKVYLPIQADVDFWIFDSNVSDNRGAVQFTVQQVSGPNDTLLARVRDAMIRGALWEQPAIAAWQNWVSSNDFGCMGCHEQTQASVGLEVSQRKVPDTPLDPRLQRTFVDAYRRWQDAEGWVSPAHGGGIVNTQTSLWAWAVAHFRGENLEVLGPPLTRALDWLRTTQRADGGWNDDHGDGNAAKLYFDGTPSATLTAGNILALANATTLPTTADVVRFTDAAISDDRVTWSWNPGFDVDLVLEPVEGVTGVRLDIRDTFASNKNFVLGEIEFYDGTHRIPVASVAADHAQNGFPASATIDGIRGNANNGWAHDANNLSPADPATAVWTFTEPTRIDRIRINQPNRGGERGVGHQIKDISVASTTDPIPSLAGPFSPLSIAVAGRELGPRREAYAESIVRAAHLFSSATWDYRRNVRTAAQTVIGLQAALPFLDEADATAAMTRLADVEAYLRSTQQPDGGWTDAGTPGVSRVFQSAQALQALIERTGSTIDAAVVAGAEYLLRSQQPDGRWRSQPLSDSTPGATTWVQIALPTIFENLSGLTLDVRHHVPLAGVDLVGGSAVPPPTGLDGGPEALSIRWETLLIGADQRRTFGLRTSLTDMQPGEFRRISNGSSVAYQSILGSDEIALPPLGVAARHVIGIAPATQTAAPGGTATYTVSLTNPLEIEQVIALRIVGDLGHSATLASPVIVPALQSVDVPLTATVGALETSGVRPFSVVAELPNGGRDTAQADLVVAGDPAVPRPRGVLVDVQPESLTAGQGTAAGLRGADGGITRFRARVVNLGDVTDVYALAVATPEGIDGSLATTALEVAPGLSNARDVALMVVARRGTAPGDYPLRVIAESTSDAAVSNDDEATVRVVGSGVDVMLDPPAGPPGSTFQLTVTNTGIAADTFQIELADAASHAATIGTTAVSLAAGESTTVPITVGAVGFAPAGTLPLMAIARSIAEPSVLDTDTAVITVSSRFDVTATFGATCVEPAANGTAALSFQVANVGNVEDAYTIEIVGLTGGVQHATISGFDGEPTQSVGAHLPGLGTGAVLLSAHVSAGTSGTVTARIRSQMDPGVAASATVVVGACSVVICGNGVVEPGEACDPTADPSGCGAMATCVAAGAPEECTCAGPACGNGAIDDGEACDPAADPSGCGMSEVCGGTGTDEACLCAPATTEICDDCLDNDGDGLTDLEDPACCAAGLEPIQLKRMSLGARRNGGVLLRMRATLHNGDAFEPSVQQDVRLQLRHGDSGELLCVTLPADQLRRTPNRLTFRDKTGRNALAQGIRSFKLSRRRNQTSRIRIKGKGFAFPVPVPGDIQATFALDAASGTAAPRCMQAAGALRSGRTGIRFP